MNIRLISSCVRIIVNLFQTYLNVKHYLTPQLDSSLNDFDVHSRSHGYGKAMRCAVILLESCTKDPNVSDG